MHSCNGAQPQSTQSADCSSNGSWHRTLSGCRECYCALMAQQIVRAQQLSARCISCAALLPPHEQQQSRPYTSCCRRTRPRPRRSLRTASSTAFPARTSAGARPSRRAFAACSQLFLAICTCACVCTCLSKVCSHASHPRTTGRSIVIMLLRRRRSWMASQD